MSNELQKSPRESVDHWDAEQLGAYICGLDPDEADTQEIENAMYEKFNIDVDNFREILSHLLPLIDYGKSPLTGKRFKGFGYTDNAGFGTWAVKMEVPEPEKTPKVKKVSTPKPSF